MIVLVVAAIGCVILARVVSALRSGAFDPWSQLSPPTSVQVLQNHASKSGFDRCDAICVSFEDDSFVDHVVTTYDLTPVKHPTSFVSLRPPAWWRVDNLTERYGRTDDEVEQYFSCWVDRDKRVLFLERGEW